MPKEGITEVKRPPYNPASNAIDIGLMHCKNRAGKSTRNTRKIYERLGYILATRVYAVYMRCLRLHLILQATARKFTCTSACRTSQGLHVVYPRDKWGSPVVQVNLSERRSQFYLPLADNFSSKSRKQLFFLRKKFSFFLSRELWLVVIPD